MEWNLDLEEWTWNDYDHDYEEFPFSKKKGESLSFS